MPPEHLNAGPQEEIDRLRERIAELENELADSQEVIAAIRSGEVDAVVVSGPEGEQVFTLRGAETAYRELVEAMNEGAATLSVDGTLLYCNQQFASMLGIPLDQVMGRPLSEFLDADSMSSVKVLVSRALAGTAAKAELTLQPADGRRVPTQLSVSKMKIEEPTALCLVATDLAESKKWEELVAAGKLTKSILESSAEGIVVCDRHGYIQSLNSLLKTLSGRNPLLEHFDQAFPLTIENKEGSESLFSIDRALQAPVRSQEVRYETPGGFIRYLLVSSGQMLDEEGVAGCVLTLTDITARKRAEQARRASEQRFSDFTVATNDVLYQMSPDWAVMFQLNGQSFLAETQTAEPNWLQKYIHPLDHSRFRAEIERAVGTRTKFELEHRVSRADGSLGWTLSRAVPTLDENGELIHWVGAARDITDRKRDEESLRATAMRLSLAQEAGQMASWQWDLATGNFVWDRGSEWTYGRPASEMTHVDVIFPYLHEDDREKVRQDLLPAIEGWGDYRSEFRVIWPDGSQHWLQAFGKSILSSDGTPVGVVGINIDITDRKLAEGALLQTEKLAAVGRLASTIAHEINNPLESVTNLLYLARTATEPSSLDSYLENAERELRRVSTIANQTLRFNKQAANPSPVHGAQLFSETLQMYQSRLLNSDLIVERRDRATRPAVCFEGEIRQVLSNLIANAIDATPTGGRLLLRSREGRNWRTGERGLALTIADSGIGMSRRVQEKIFDAFFSTKGIGGTGLGLWVSKELVERHGGTLTVRSSTNSGAHGTVFILFLPCAFKAS